MISLHTSPLDQPGTGDAGGMNVYVIELSRQLAQQGIEVDIFTRATTSALPPVVEAFDGVRVRHVIPLRQPRDELSQPSKQRHQVLAVVFGALLRYTPKRCIAMQVF